MKKWKLWCIIFHFQRIFYHPSNRLMCTPYGFLLFLKPLLTLNVYFHIKLISFQNLTYLLQYPFFWLVENFTYYSIRVVVNSLVKMFKGFASKSGSLCLTRYPTLMNPINPSKINYMILPTKTNISSSFQYLLLRYFLSYHNFYPPFQSHRTQPCEFPTITYIPISIISIIFTQCLFIDLYSLLELLSCDSLIISSFCNTLLVLPSYAKIPMLPFLHHSHTFNYPHFFLSIHWLHLIYPSFLSPFPLSLTNKIHNISSLLWIYYSGSIIYTSFYLISSLFSSLQSPFPSLTLGFTPPFG